MHRFTDQVFDEFQDDLHLAVLLRVFNQPQLHHPKALPYLKDLAREGYLENTAKSWQSEWWSLTSKGREVVRAFASAIGDRKESFLRKTYRVFE